MVLSIFRLLCNHHHHRPPELFVSSQTETVPMTQKVPISLFSARGAPLCYDCNTSRHLMQMGTSYEWNHSTFILSDWLFPLCTSSGFIHVVEGVRISFLIKADYHFFLCGYTRFISVSIDPLLDAWFLYFSYGE